jgi:hypothetical protein
MLNVLPHFVPLPSFDMRGTSFATCHPSIHSGQALPLATRCNKKATGHARGLGPVMYRRSVYRQIKKATGLLRRGLEMVDVMSTSRETARQWQDETTAISGSTNADEGNHVGVNGLHCAVTSL